MSADEADDLTPTATAYVDSFRRAERPSDATVSRSWAAVEAAVAAAPAPVVAPWRRPWVIVSATLAAAAAIALLAQGAFTGTEIARVAPPNSAPDLGPTPPVQPTTARELPAPAVLPSAPAVENPPEPVTPTPTPADDRARPTRRERPPGAAVVDDNSLAEETRLWQAAQAALGRGDAQDALDTVDKWASRFPKGHFVDERTLVQARALCRAGLGERARQVRDRFLKARPDAPLASRMREVCPEDVAP